ncbi:hypothetical protein EDF66_11691 [Sphingobacterium sp. JUb20]|nr:hypothetical protein [Sphingobacterium sp. JUb21]TCQ98981.1 hypothetical protein EDF66_11691 [Sphingobacterium sp. JUb20]
MGYDQNLLHTFTLDHNSYNATIQPVTQLIQNQKSLFS